MVKLTQAQPVELPYSLEGLTQVQVEKLCSLLCTVKDDDLDEVLEALNDISSVKWRAAEKVNSRNVSINGLRMKAWR